MAMTLVNVIESTEEKLSISKANSVVVNRFAHVA